MRVLVTGGSGFIGTNLLEALDRVGCEVINLDIAAPRNPDIRAPWKHVDLRDGPAVQAAVNDFRPTHTVHLGARTNLVQSPDLSEYTANTIGTKNLIEALSKTSTCRRTLYASSRLVFKIGHSPAHALDYRATTDYGRSKIEMEAQVIGGASDAGEWAIIRPTSIWGPWFGVPYRDFFMSVLKRRYVHPRGRQISKSFGYVGNCVAQILALLSAPAHQVDKQIFFLADYNPVDVLAWSNLINSAAGRARTRQVPMSVLSLAAHLGDVMVRAGRTSQLTTFRLENLVTPMIYDLSDTQAVLHDLPYDIDEGVRRTIEWLLHQGEL